MTPREEMTQLYSQLQTAQSDDERNVILDQIEARTAQMQQSSVPYAAIPGVIEADERSVLAASRPYLNEVLQGFTLGGADELMGVLGNEEAMQEMRASSAQMAQDSPWLQMGLNVAGGLINPLARLTGRFVGGAPTLPGAIGRAGLAGAGEGATAGALYTDPTTGNRMLGAVIGGGLGAPMAMAGQFGAELARRFMGGGANQAAQNRVARALIDDEITPQDLINMPSTGAPETIPERVARSAGLTRPQDTTIGGLTRSLGTKPGPARLAANRTLRGREDELYNRVRGYVGQAFDADAQPIDRVRARAMYDAYRAVPYDVPEDSPVRNLIRQHKELKKGIQEGRSQYLADNPERVAAGTLTASDPEVQWNWDVLHNVKTSLDSQIKVAKRAGDDAKARRLMQLKTQYLDKLQEWNPAYRDARQFYASEASRQNARELGNEINKMTKDDVRLAMANLSPVELEQFRAGAFETMVGELNKVRGETPNFAQRLMANQDWKDRIRTISPSDEMADVLFDRLKAESRGHESFAGMGGGSQTQLRAEEVDAENIFTGIRDLLFNPLHGAGVVAHRAISNIGARPAPYERELARILTEYDPAEVQQILQSLQRPGVGAIGGSGYLTGGMVPSISNVIGIGGQQFLAPQPYE